MVDAIDPIEAKEAMRAYVEKKGGLAFGVADVAALERIAPEGYGPSAMLPRVKSVISVGVGGGTRGSWRQTPKPLPISATRRPWPIGSPMAWPL